MDTRQLAAFCAVVERRSFSQAAERLGVTQPAISLQVRALEKRLGAQLLDRSGRRVEPTEAGLRLYRGAQRLLQLEEQLLDEVAAEGEGALTGELSIGASTGPAAIVVPVMLCEFQRRNPDVKVALEVHDTQAVVERVADRELELGIVGAARRHRGVRFEPFLRDEVILICPPGHPFAGRSVSIDELRAASLILMQEGAGVRQVVEDELRRLGARLRDLDVQLETVYSPYRELTRPIMRFVDELEARYDNDIITVLIPEFVVSHWWQHILHNQSALILKGRLLFRKGLVVTSVPYHTE